MSCTIRARSELEFGLDRHGTAQYMLTPSTRGEQVKKKQAIVISDTYTYAVPIQPWSQIPNTRA